MPVGVLLAYPLGLGVVGLWWGLVIGLATVAVILVFRVRRVLRRPLVRFEAEPRASGDPGVRQVPAWETSGGERD